MDGNIFASHLHMWPYSSVLTPVKLQLFVTYERWGSIKTIRAFS